MKTLVNALLCSISTLAGLQGCASQAPAVGPAAQLEQRCVSSDGVIGGSTCAAGGVLATVPACREGVAPSTRWHVREDPARGRAARDGSLVGDGDETGPYCLPAPPR